MSEITWQIMAGLRGTTLTAADTTGGGARLTIVYAPGAQDEPTPTVRLDAGTRREFGVAVARLHGAMLAGDQVRRPRDPASQSYRWEAELGESKSDHSQLSAHWHMGHAGGLAGPLVEVLDIFVADWVGHTYSVWLRTEQAGEFAAWLARDGAPERIEA